MTGIYVTVPIACFRKGLAREYLETEVIPPPSTCYGFLLSLVGETVRNRHIGVRITAALLTQPEMSRVLRNVWRVKTPKYPLGSVRNARPDYQQLLSGVRLVLWLDSAEEVESGDTLEIRVQTALDPSRRSTVSRFGGLSMGESTHLVDEVSLFDPDATQKGQIFQLAAEGQLSLPVWVDHAGSVGTRYETGTMESSPLIPPAIERVPQIRPPVTS